MPNYLKTDIKGIVALNLLHQHKHALLDLVWQNCRTYETILAVSFLSDVVLRMIFKGCLN